MYQKNCFLSHKLVCKKKVCTQFLNLIVSVCLFFCLSVCHCHCKNPTSGGQKKFWSKVLAPILASDDQILEIFHFNDFHWLSFLCHKTFLQTFLSHYFHCGYCPYCSNDYKWPFRGPSFTSGWSDHSLFSLILKQDWMRLSQDISSNQDRMTPAWPVHYLIKCPALCLLD